MIVANGLLLACSRTPGGGGDAGAPPESSAASDAGHSADARSDGGSGPDGSRDGGTDGGGGDPCASGGWTFPADSRVIDITLPPYNADKTGAVDDTAIIQQAIFDHIQLGGGKTDAGYFAPDEIIYFPNGTYLVSDRLEWRRNTPSICPTGYVWGAYLSFWGQCQTKTILELKDNTPAFGNPNAGRAVLYTAAIAQSDPCDLTNSDWPDLGEGNTAFRNNLSNFTIDVGQGNPGAIAIDYLANNQARIENVTLTGHPGSGNAGLVGLQMTRKYPGPLFFTNVEVSYFGTGVLVGGGDYSASVTFEDLTISNVAQGLVNNDDMVFGRHLTVTTSDATAPAVANQGNGFIALIDSTLAAVVPSAGTDAISNDSADTASMYLRDIHLSGGYGSIISGLAAISGDWTSSPILSLGGTGTGSLGLPIQDTPVVLDTDTADWISVETYGAMPDDQNDDSPGIAAALAAATAGGKRVVYFPQGQYFLGSTITLSSPIHLLGLGAILSPKLGFTGPAFDITSTSGVVALERIFFLSNDFGAGAPWAVPVLRDSHAAPGVVVLKDVSDATYAADSGAPVGDVYIEDCDGGPFVFGNGQNVWARQLDSEVGVTHVMNTGAKVWILGLKTEERPDAGFCATALDTEDGGETELIGGAIEYWPVQCTSSQPPFVANRSRQSLAFAMAANATNSVIGVAIQQSLDGGPPSDLHCAGEGTPAAYLRGSDMSTVPLFVGY
jgi:Pectate lyase superfamily protein